MPVSDVIARRAIALTLLRPVEDAIVDGYVTPTTESIAGTTGHMQPLSGLELRFVPEGMVTLEWWNIWSLDELREADIVTDGNTVAVTVIRVDRWKEGAFYHAQGTKITDYTLLPGGLGAATIIPTATATGSHP